jgi:SAM-dependent methyltransferase
MSAGDAAAGDAAPSVAPSDLALAAAMSPPPAGPRRVDVTAAYDLGVDTYASLWSPVIRPPARSVVAALGLRGAPRVLDIGAGPGSLVSSILDAAPAARVVALDASIEMLRAARRHTSDSAIRGDALALPIGDTTVDAVLCAFVLFHLSDPSAAVAEVARVLRTGGRVGTVTWVREATVKASAVWDEAFADAGVPPLPPRRVDTGLDSPEAMGALFTAGGLQPHRIWLERLTHRWEPSTYWRLVTGTGANRARLRLVDEDGRAALLATAHTRLEALDPEDFAWWGEVVCAVASKPG